MLRWMRIRLVRDNCIQIYTFMQQIQLIIRLKIVNLMRYKFLKKFLSRKENYFWFSSWEKLCRCLLLQNAMQMLWKLATNLALVLHLFATTQRRSWFGCNLTSQFCIVCTGSDIKISNCLHQRRIITEMVHLLRYSKTFSQLNNRNTLFAIQMSLNPIKKAKTYC